MQIRSALATLTLTAGIALLLGSPAVAEPAATAAPSILPPSAAVSGFAPVRRDPLPGERTRSDFAGTLPNDLSSGVNALAFDGSAAVSGGTGVASDNFSLQVRGGTGNIGDFRDDRVSRLLGDGVLIYDNPLNTGYYGYNPRTGRYDRWHGSLSYNHAFLKNAYGGNLAGTPSVNAPLDFWSGRR